MGVPLSVMPLVQGRISFGVQAVSPYETVDDLGTTTGATGVELSTPMSFDPLAPGLSFSDPADRAVGRGRSGVPGGGPAGRLTGSPAGPGRPPRTPRGGRPACTGAGGGVVAH